MYGYASGKWDNVFQNFQKRRKPNLWGISYRESSPHLIFLLEFQELSVGWFVIGEFNDSRIFRKRVRSRALCLHQFLWFLCVVSLSLLASLKKSYNVYLKTVRL